jgi:glyceraldehyde 3-phosphate dehydrogenase
VHGIYGGEVSFDDNSITVDGKKTPVFIMKSPGEIMWGDLGADIAVEATGIFKKRNQAQKHIDAGAKKVLISAPAKDGDGMFVLGVNDEKYDPAKHHIISIGSCTTNCLAPVAKVLLDSFGIEKGFMTTVHAYTGNQNILDLPHKKGDFRRARAGALSMIPTTTGAAKAISYVIPELEGRMDGCAIRVPTPDGSLVDLVAILEKEVTVDNVKSAVKEAAAGRMKGFLQYTEDPIVSIDVVGNSHSSIFDAQMTMASGKLVKVFSWYDNEWGFSYRMIDMIKKMM